MVLQAAAAAAADMVLVEVEVDVEEDTVRPYPFLSVVGSLLCG